MKSAKRKVHWLEMRPDELLERLETEPVCYAAYGLAEPHGPYNPLGLDFLKAQALCERAACALGGVVAPPFAWHVQDQPKFDWCRKQGIQQTLCSAIPADLWLRILLHQIAVFDARGFHAAFLITGHYGGLEQDMRLLCDYYLRKTGSPMKLQACADWELIWFEDYGGDHAGVTETSQLLALCPGLTDLSRTVVNSRTGSWAGIRFPDKHGRKPSATIGEKIVESQIEAIRETKARLLRSYSPNPSYTAPDQDQVDDLWARFERITRKYWILSLTYEEYGQGKRAEFPGWEALGL